MHILIVPSWYPTFSGDISGCFFREQALALKKNGHQVGVIDVKFRLPRSLKLLFNGFFGTVDEVDEGLLTYRFCGMDWFRQVPWMQRWLWIHYGIKLVERYVSLHGKPDVIHAHAMLNGGVLAKAVSEKYSIPFVVTEHSSAFAFGYINQHQRELARGVAVSATRCFAVSDTFCKLLELQFGDTGLRWEEIPNIIEQKFIDTKLPKSPNRTEPFTFMTVALLTENKAVHNLVTAFKQAFGDDPNVILKIGGDGIEHSRLEALAIELGVKDRVLFLGMLSRGKVLEEMSKMSVFVLPSRYETFGVVIVEALALGKPVIATRCGGPESIVREQDGVLVPTDDVAALAEAMKRMRSNYESYDGRAIRAACVARYSEAVIARRLTTIYSEVLASTAVSKIKHV